jgi:steroid delta-isomerase-like uncharacterized protein
MSEQNQTVSRRYFLEIMNQANWNTLHEILTPDFVFTLPTHPEPYRTPDGFKELVTMLHGAFPDFYIDIRDMVSDGDTVVTRWWGGGRHTGGPLRTTSGDLKASGRRFDIDGITWHVFRDGKIAEAIGHEDTLGLMLQLGAIPPPPDAPVPLNPGDARGLVARYFGEIMNQGKLDVVPQVLHPKFSFVIPTLPEPVTGYDGFSAFVTGLRTAFPDLKFEVLREIASSNRVASRWRFTGTHKGTFLGMPPTGRAIQDLGIDIFQISSGKILRIDVNEDDFGLMRQLGLFGASK